jgi:hypothetical protein
MGFYRQYDPSDIIVSIGSNVGSDNNVGSDITGFVDGTFVEIERAEDSFKKHVGATGDVTRTKLNDRSAKITLTLMAESTSNDDLAGMLLIDETDGSATFSIQIKDVAGNMYCHAENAWIMKAPKIERGGKDAAHTVWVIECASLEIRAGSNVVSA